MKRIIIPGFFVMFAILAFLCFNIGAAATVFSENKFVVREGKDQLSYGKVAKLGYAVNPQLDYYHNYTVKEVYSRSGIFYKVQRDTLANAYVTLLKK